MNGQSSFRYRSPVFFLATILSILLATATVSAAGTTYYVSDTGDDANPGTFSNPWRHVQKAANAATPGSTVYVRAGVYKERVTVRVSGSAEAGTITFRNYPGEVPVLDGTGLVVPDVDNGMFLIANRAYITIRGFEIRNYRTATRNIVPAGIHVRGTSHHVRILNNRIHHIEHNGTWTDGGVDAFGICVFGTRAQSVNNVIIDGNELYALKLGSSESLVVNGNVENFRITHNKVHNNNNIGIVAIGFEEVSPYSGTDQARNGVIADNIVYGINSYGNPAYGTDRSADGIYVDGGRDIVIERNIVHHCNIGIELASEHAGRSTSYVTVRNNFIYLNDIIGISMGGYDAQRGNAVHCTVVNNTLFRNDRLKWGNGELCLQYDTRYNIIKNNIFYANDQSCLISNEFTQNTGNSVDYNIYFAPDGASYSEWHWKKHTYTGFAAYRAATGNDAHSRFVNPQLVSTSTPNLHIQTTSPAIDKGRNLTSAGTKDIDGEARIQNGTIDVGADEVQ